MATPDTRSSIVITKSFTYRGGTRDFSNRYHFEGSVPPDSGHWATLGDAIVAAEKTCYDPDVVIVHAIGNDSATASPTNPHGDAVWEKTYAEAGTYAPGSSSTRAPGDCAILLRYSTLARTTKNHPVYLFNYFHGVWLPDDTIDQVAAGQIEAVEAYADLWLTGFSDGTGDKQRCGPRGAAAVSRLVNQQVHHRDFPN